MYVLVKFSEDLEDDESDTRKDCKKDCKKKDCKKISFFLRKVVKTVFFACFTTRETT